MADIGIVGYGRVGRAVEYGFKEGNTIRAFDVDPKRSKNTLEDTVKNSEFVFVSVWSPYKVGEGGYPIIDLSYMDESLGKITAMTNKTGKIVILKSTVIPGTTRAYAKKYPRTHFCSNPEFLTEKNYLEDFVNADRRVIGADETETALRVIQLYRDTFPKTPIVKVNPTEAEMIKYASNCLLATKVIFANEIKELCDRLGISYEGVREGVIADSRIGNSHLKVTTEKGFGEKCFPKDLMALIGLFKDLNVDSSLLESVWNKNNKIRDPSHRDWEDGKIPGVQS